MICVKVADVLACRCKQAFTFDAVLLALIWAGDQNQGSFQLKALQVLRVP